MVIPNIDSSLAGRYMHLPKRRLYNMKGLGDPQNDVEQLNANNV